MENTHYNRRLVSHILTGSDKYRYSINLPPLCCVKINALIFALVRCLFVFLFVFFVYQWSVNRIIKVSLFYKTTCLSTSVILYERYVHWSSLNPFCAVISNTKMFLWINPYLVPAAQSHPENCELYFFHSYFNEVKLFVATCRTNWNISLSCSQTNIIRQLSLTLLLRLLPVFTQNSETTAQLSGGNRNNSGDFGIQSVGMPGSASE